MKVLALIGVMVLLHSGDSQGRQQLTIGQDGQISWEGAVEAGAAVQTIEPEYRSTLDPNITELGVAPVNLVDFANADFPASILPRRVQEGQNLAAEIAERGGSIRAPTVFDLPESQLQNILAQIVSPDPTGIAFERKGRDVHGTLLVLDLGARFGVNQIRFFPRNTVFSVALDALSGRFSQKLRGPCQRWPSVDRGRQPDLGDLCGADQQHRPGLCHSDQPAALFALHPPARRLGHPL